MSDDDDQILGGGYEQRQPRRLYDSAVQIFWQGRGKSTRPLSLLNP